MYSRCLSVCFAAVLLTACERETRRFTHLPLANTSEDPVAISKLEPGPRTAPDTAAPNVAGAGRYEDNAFDIARGKQLFSMFNCVGCHANGGGGMGPPLMDNVWIYGSDSAKIAETITRGRPNGMPAFGSKVGRQQILQLTAYVRSMSGRVPKDAAPGRSDHMHAKAPEAMTTTDPSEK